MFFRSLARASMFFATVVTALALATSLAHATTPVWTAIPISAEFVDNSVIINLKDQGVLIVTDYASNVAKLARLIELIDRQRVALTTEFVKIQYVDAAALADPDARPLQPQQMARMKRMPQVRVIRRALRLSQEEFARRHRIPIGTLRA